MLLKTQRLQSSIYFTTNLRPLLIINHVKIIKRYLTSYLSVALLTNLSEFPTSCFFIQFFILINMLDMFHHIGS